MYLVLIPESDLMHLRREMQLRLRGREKRLRNWRLKVDHGLLLERVGRVRNLLAEDRRRHQRLQIGLPAVPHAKGEVALGAGGESQIAPAVQADGVSLVTLQHGEGPIPGGVQLLAAADADFVFAVISLDSFYSHQAESLLVEPLQLLTSSLKNPQLTKTICSKKPVTPGFL
jgi:hypothetical protein